MRDLINPQWITREPDRDVTAQVRAVRDRRYGKDAALVSPANMGAVPDLSGLHAIPTNQGLFVTSNRRKAQQAGSQLSTEQIGRLLGYGSNKVDTDGTVVQSLDSQGNVIHEEATSAGQLDRAIRAAQQAAPQGRLVITDAPSVQARRSTESGAEMQGMNPMLMQMLMSRMGGQAGGMPQMGGQGGGMGGMGGMGQPPVSHQPMAPQPANLGFPTGQPGAMPQYQQHMNMGQRGQMFSPTAPAMPQQQQPGWWQRNGANTSQALFALSNMF